jgi:hypothetical protein
MEDFCIELLVLNLMLYYLYTIIKAYVGAATVGASCWWFMESSNGPKLNYWHLVS